MGVLATPASYASGEKTYPVIYILDGNFNFGMAADLTHLLAYGPDVPDLIIVGIGNHIARYGAIRRLACSFYTPC